MTNPLSTILSRLRRDARGETVLEPTTDDIGRATPPVPAARQAVQPSGGVSPLQLGRRQRPVSAINDPVWRLALWTAGASIVGTLFFKLFGTANPFGMWLGALVLAAGWVSAIRLLLLDTRLRRFWIGWLLLGAAVSLATRLAMPALFSSWIFLLFRAYRPLRHLSSSRRARVMLVALASAIVLLAGLSLGDSQGGVLGFGRAVARYALTSLQVFWVMVVVHLVVKARLHFLRLKPKLAFSGGLIAIVPLVLVVTLGLLVLYGAIGGHTASRGRSIMRDWAKLVDEREEMGPALFGAGFSANATELPSDAPFWAKQVMENLSVAEAPGRGSWAPHDTTAYVSIAAEMWLLRIRNAGSEELQLQAFPVSDFTLDRLAGLLYGNVSLVLGNVQIDEDEDGSESIQFQTDDAAVTLRGDFHDSPAGADSSSSIFKRSLYFGGAPMKVFDLQDDRFVEEDILLTTQIRLADLGGQFVSGENELNLALTIVLGIIAAMFLLVEVFSLFFGLRIATGITSAVRTLHRGTEELAKGNLNVRIDLPNEDEFGDLAESFNEMTFAVRQGQEEAIARERLERELRMARDIQERLLPLAAPNLPGYQIVGWSEPSRQVGGDYYDFLELPGGILGVAVGDVSGKGIPAALLMSNLQASLKGQVIHPGGVGDMVAKVNNLLVDSTDVTMFATFFYGVLNRLLGTFTATNAGHDPPIICRADGTIERMRTGGLMLGVLEGQTYSEETIDLAPGDVLVLYTDGVTEAQGPLDALPAPKGTGDGGSSRAAADDDDDDDDDDFDEQVNLFEEERLLEIIKANHHRDADDIKDAILNAVTVHTSGTPQSDDITLVVIKRSES